VGEYGFIEARETEQAHNQGGGHADEAVIRWYAYRHLSIFIILTASLIGTLVARAESPWMVSLVPTKNPLPIGGCAAVRLQLLDRSSKDSPRNPRGAYVSLADFDFTVTAADQRSVAGQYDGASYFSACACQGAAVGAIATVTATYPAATLAPEARVPGVAFQTSATFALAKANGASDSPACAGAAGKVPMTDSTSDGLSMLIGRSIGIPSWE
jgi:hypothetical protein